jgi:hypothetical protein
MPRVSGHGTGPYLRHHYGEQDGSVDKSGATSPADIGDLHAMSDAGMKAMFAKQAGSISTSKTPTMHAPHAPHAEHKEKGTTGRMLAAAGKSLSRVKEAGAKTAEAAVAGSGTEQAAGAFKGSLRGHKG